MNRRAVKQKIEALLRRYAWATSQSAYSSVVPPSMTPGKLYEAHVVSRVIEELVVQEGYQVVLKNSAFLPLKSGTGPINQSYAYFELRRGSSLQAEIWTDVDFISLSCAARGNASSPAYGDYHELDILVTTPGLSGRPLFSDIWLGVECKKTGYTKKLLKEILGIRREMSLLASSNTTRFSKWPRSSVPTDPPSCLMVYTTDRAVSGYSGPGQVFGVDFIYEPI